MSRVFRSYLDYQACRQSYLLAVTREGREEEEEEEEKEEEEEAGERVDGSGGMRVCVG